jgi:hypothetical protein
MYFARGSGQKLAEQPTGFSVPGQQVFEAVEKHYRSSAVGSVADAYLALNVASFFGGLYGPSAANGAETAVQNLTDLTQLCPSSWLVLGGFSQGAQAIRTALGRLGPAVRKRIAAVTLFGDPYFSLKDANVIVEGTPKKGRAGVLRWGPGRTPPIEGDYAGRVFSWCHAKDFVCQTLGSFKAHKTYAGLDPKNPDGTVTDATDAAARIVDRLSALGVPPELPAKTYLVRGTCAAESCVLVEWSGPGIDAFAAAGEVREGNQVAVACQARGEEIHAADASNSAIWDRLVSGNFVSDLYLNTPMVGRFSPHLPHCPPLVVSDG